MYEIYLFLWNEYRIKIYKYLLVVMGTNKTHMLVALYSNKEKWKRIKGRTPSSNLNINKISLLFIIFGLPWVTICWKYHVVLEKNILCNQLYKKHHFNHKSFWNLKNLLFFFERIFTNLQLFTYTNQYFIFSKFNNEFAPTLLALRAVV